MEKLIQLFKNHWQTVSLVTLLLTALVFAISAFLAPQYESKMSILVIQKQPEDKVDAFSAAKSAEYLSDIFSKVTYSDSFIDDVIQSPLNIKREFSTDREERKKEWEKDIKVKKVNNTGILEISVFDPSRKEAEKIVQAIAWNLSTNNGRYHGGGQKIAVNAIDGPITSQNQARPNVLLNSLLAFLIGITGSLGFFYFVEEAGKKNRFSVNTAPNYEADKNYFEIKPQAEETNYFPPKEEMPVISEEDYFASFSHKVAPPENLPTSLKKDELEKTDIFPEEKAIIFPEATSEEVKARLNKLLQGKL
jgi:capsular polysaccharide biosynthesis protein